MKIYNDINEFSKVNCAVVTIGTFDGVHLGHQKIINRLERLAKKAGGESVVLTFFPHPRMILHPEDTSIKLISTIEEKAQLLKRLGVDHLIITPFTRDFSNLNPQEYIKNILVEKLGMKYIVIGYDHRFGKDREGGLVHLQQYAPIYDFQIEEIPKQDINEVTVSSSKIRNALFNGDVKTAREFLSHPFQLVGKVIKGDQIGRKIGFPTANIFVEEEYKLIPADGIYAVQIALLQDSEGGTKTEVPLALKGMAYIGNRPTLNGMKRNIEVHIFDFDVNIYDQFIRISFLHFVRNDQKFISLQALQSQLLKDQKVTKKLLFGRV